ncbi:MAG: sporulation initiation factor Spo0A C-terminal domain-containing protein [Clostridia bacterium]|nr:sporulation initiation factor Spo0A C-terminal domain-containing protein [Clostridia bacterium]
MRIMLLSGDRKRTRAYTDAAEETGGVRLCVLKNTAQVLERFFRDPFDALLSDDPSVLLPRIQNCAVQWPNHIFLLLSEPPGGVSFPKTLTFCFSKDADPKTVLSRVAMFPEGHRSRNSTEVDISRFLQQVGVPVSLSGFDYLREAIRLILAQESTVSVGHVNDLYGILAMENGVSAGVAEHAMRHAIDTAWIRADTALLEKLFGYTVRSDRGAPSNAAFLFRAADHIRLLRGGAVT